MGMEGECTNPLRLPHAPPAFALSTSAQCDTQNLFLFTFTPPPGKHSIRRLLAYGAQFFYK